MTAARKPSGHRPGGTGPVGAAFHGRPSRGHGRHVRGCHRPMCHAEQGALGPGVLGGAPDPVSLPRPPRSLPWCVMVSVAGHGAPGHKLPRLCPSTGWGLWFPLMLTWAHVSSLSLGRFGGTVPVFVREHKGGHHPESRSYLSLTTWEFPPARCVPFKC